MRRRLKEAVRLTQGEFDLVGNDFILIARAGSARRGFPLLLDDVKRALLSLSEITS